MFMAENNKGILPDHDIETAVSEEKSEETAVFVNEYIDHFRTLFRERENEQMQRELPSQLRETEWLSQKYQSDRDNGFLVGLYRGVLLALREYLYGNAMDDRIRRTLSKEKAEDIPHFHQIIFAIEDEEGIRHGELAKKVGLDKATLSGIMDRIVDSGAVIFSRPGKFKYYFLTSSGKRFCDLHRESFSAAQNIDALITQITEAIAKSDDPDETAERVLGAIYRKKPGKKSDVFRIAAGLGEMKPRIALTNDAQAGIHQVSGAAVLSGYRSEPAIMLEFESADSQEDFQRRESNTMCVQREVR